MGILDPAGYLSCDGTVYNISDFSVLAGHIEAHFGSVNYFGGDGLATFAVPDLRGEFLRGTGTNSRVNEGSGENVGTHQDATWHLFKWNATGSQVTVYNAGYTGGTNADFFGPVVQHGTYGTWSNKNYVNQVKYYTSRPTNTSVLYIIKY